MVAGNNFLCQNILVFCKEGEKEQMFSGSMLVFPSIGNLCQNVGALKGLWVLSKELITAYCLIYNANFSFFPYSQM